MTPNWFEHLLQIVAPCIEKRTAKCWEPISAVQQLALTLWYLATRESQQWSSLIYHIGKATVSKIVSKTAMTIYNSLRDPFMKVPSLKEEWLNISVGFKKSWNFLHCVGSIDGKHIQVVQKWPEPVTSTIKVFIASFFW